MPNQSVGAPFLERMLRQGKKQNALLSTPRSGGVGLPSPTGLGSGQNPPPRPTPAAAAQVAPAGGVTPTPPQPPTSTVQRQAPPSPDDMPLPSLDEEFPIDTLKDADGGGKVFPAISLRDRFYRVYGRQPVDTDMYILNIRKQFEEKVGRSPSKRDLLEAVRRVIKTTEGVKPV